MSSRSSTLNYSVYDKSSIQRIRIYLMNCKHSLYRFTITALFSLIASVLSPLAFAAQDDIDSWPKQATATIKNQEKSLEGLTTENTKVEMLNASLKEISKVKGKAQECITESEALLLKTTQDLEILGEEIKKENPEVTKKRRSLAKEQKTLDQELATCKLLLIQSQDLTKSINELQQRILAQQLSARTPHIFQIVQENLSAPAAGWQDAMSFLKTQYQLKLLTAQQLSLLTVFVLIFIVLGIVAGRILRPKSELEDIPSDTLSAFTLALKSSLARALPVLLPVAVIAAFLSIVLPLTPLPFMTKVSYVIVSYISLIVLINILLCPDPPAHVYLTKPEDLSRRFAWHLKVLLTLGAIGFFLFTGEFKASLSDPVYYLNRGLFCILLIINLITILWLVRNFSWAILSRKPRIFLSTVLLATLIAELAGYRNLSSFVLGGLLSTSIGLAITLLIYRLFKDLCDGLDEGRLEWEERFRQLIGLKDDGPVPGLIWIRVIIFTVLWGGFVILAFYIWRLDDPWLTIISGYITEGFQVGSLAVTPKLLGSGILALFILLSLTRYAKNHILPHGLKHTRLDRGAKEAVTSLFGYAGVAIAILVALSITGVKMQNIALIAGALSVGIGFGLQNIVNNFISGLILLFERPIRRGDWIITGDTEGYVKSINIRSTQIQTFDQSDVIVPNSELITAKVTNWMLRDAHGRITVSIGVGYDSDVDKVRHILLDIAQNHPMVMNNKKTAPLKVLFRNFGDSALNFELRCFIYDIDQRVNIISEINFAIIKAFREEGVEIPFPQRVVTFNNPIEQK